jgi:hypothetical protein
MQLSFGKLFFPTVRTFRKAIGKKSQHQIVFKTCMAGLVIGTKMQTVKKGSSIKNPNNHQKPAQIIYARRTKC